MQGGWQPPPGGGGGGYGAPPGGGGYGAPPGGGYGGVPPGGTQQGYGGPPGGFAPNPYGGGAPGGMMQPQFGNYEFNDYENSVVDKLAGRAKLWGIISAVIGSLYLISSCGFFFKPDLLMNAPGGIVAIIVGVVFIGAGNSLKAVVQTQGNDMQHLMTAFQKMTTAFMIEICCAIAGFALGIIAFMLVAFVFVAAAASQ